MTAPVPRAPTHLQPHPKASATSTTTSQPTSSRPGPQSTPLRTSTRARSATQVAAAVSDSSTTSLIRRTLCPHADKRQPLATLLPPLTSSNAVDLQLYGLVAVVVREFVYAWYGKITPDRGFVEEVVAVLAHCVRALEGRGRAVDWEAVLGDEVPEVLGAHVRGGLWERMGRREGWTDG